MSRPLVRATAPLRGTITVPGDKSLSHRSTLLALLADGPCRATGWLDCADTRSSLEAVRALGAAVAVAGGEVTVTPPARPPQGPVLVDCGNSGTTARLLLGLLAGWLQPGGPAVTLTGDDSLRGRPMARVVEPLRRMGAAVDWAGTAGTLPVTVRGAQLRGVSHDLPVASAQVKSALLLAGLGAVGTTVVRGAAGSRDHTERLLRDLGLLCEPGLPGEPDRRHGPGPRAAGRDLAPSVTGPCRLPAFSLRVPGDPSSAAFFQAAAALVPGSDVSVRGQSLNPTRTGALAVLARAGARVETALSATPAVARVGGAPAGGAPLATDTARADEGGANPAGEPIGDVRVRAGELNAFAIDAAEVPSLVDEIPVLAVLATQCRGRTVIGGAAELRVKESDRLALLADGLQRLGATVTERPDGLVIDGPTPLRGGTTRAPLVLATGGDHRLAMALAVAALVAEGETVLDTGACVAISFPGFYDVRDRLLAGDAR